MRENPSFAEQVIITLAARLRRINTWLEDAYFNDLDTRLAPPGRAGVRGGGSYFYAGRVTPSRPLRWQGEET